jgi:hypothetical protein
VATARELRVAAAKAAAQLRSARASLDEADSDAERTAAQRRVDAAEAALSKANDELRASTGESVTEEGQVTTSNELIETGKVRMGLTPVEAARAALRDRGVNTDDVDDRDVVVQAQQALEADRKQWLDDLIRQRTGKDPDELSPAQQNAVVEADALDQLRHSDATRTRPVNGLTSAADALRRAAQLDDPDEADEAIEEALQDGKDDSREWYNRQIVASLLDKDADDLGPSDFAEFARRKHTMEVEAITGKRFDELTRREIFDADRALREQAVEAGRRAADTTGSKGKTGDGDEREGDHSTRDDSEGERGNDGGRGVDAGIDTRHGSGLQQGDTGQRGDSGTSNTPPPEPAQPNTPPPEPAQPKTPPPEPAQPTPPNRAEPVAPEGPAGQPDAGTSDDTPLPPILVGDGTVSGGEHDGKHATVYEDPATGGQFAVLDDGTVLEQTRALDDQGRSIKAVSDGGETVVTPGTSTPSTTAPTTPTPPPAGEREGDGETDSDNSDDSDDSDDSDNSDDSDDSDSSDDSDDSDESDDSDDSATDEGGDDTGGETGDDAGSESDADEQVGTSLDPDSENARRGEFVSLLPRVDDIVRLRSAPGKASGPAGTPTPDDEGEPVPAVGQLIGGGLLTDRPTVRPGVGNPGAPGGLRASGAGLPLDSVSPIDDPGAIDPGPDADTPQTHGRELDPFAKQRPKSEGFPARRPTGGRESEDRDDGEGDGDGGERFGLGALPPGSTLRSAPSVVRGHRPSVTGKTVDATDDESDDDFGSGARTRMRATLAPRPPAPAPPPAPTDSDPDDTADDDADGTPDVDVTPEVDPDDTAGAESDDTPDGDPA